MALDWRKYAAEFLGAFILVFGGSLAILAVNETQGPLMAVVPFGFGLSLLAGVAAFGHVSGGHFNPAVSIAALLDRRIDVISTVIYIVVQIIGAIAASGLILYLTGSQDDVLATRTLPGGGFGESQAFVLETVMTAVFLVVILATTKKSPAIAALLIPLTLVSIHLAAIPFSGSSVNPARSLGPAIVGANLDSIWVYIAGPIAGAIIGWFIWSIIASREPESAGSEAETA